MGPATNFENVNLARTPEEVASVGGTIIRATAGAALLLGDIVYVSDELIVNKSDTPGAYAAYIGVVVGGASFNSMGYVNSDSNVIGQAAAAEDEFVLVQTTGICYAISDDTISAGDLLEPSAAVAGTVVAQTAEIPLVGIALEDSVDEAPVKMFILGALAASASAAADALTGTELASNVVDSSLTSLGTIADLNATDLTVTGESSIDGAVLMIENLPTADPEVVGQVWNNGGVLTVSEGPP